MRCRVFESSDKAGNTAKRLDSCEPATCVPNQDIPKETLRTVTLTADPFPVWAHVILNDSRHDDKNRLVHQNRTKLKAEPNIDPIVSKCNNFKSFSHNPPLKQKAKLHSNCQLPKNV